MAEIYADIAHAGIAPATPSSAAPKRAAARRRGGGRAEFYVLYGCCFSLFLAGVIARRALVSTGILAASADANPPLIREVREAVGSVIPYAFMG
jgi:hypothetical protein